MPAAPADGTKEHGHWFVDGFTPGQKAVTILGVVALVIASVTFMTWASKSDHASSAPPRSAGSQTPAAARTSGADAELASAQAYDAELEQRIEDMVGNTLGPGHAAVTVAAQLDDSKRSSVTTQYGEVRPNATVPITQNDDHETLAPGPASGQATPTTVYEKTQTQHHNAVDSTVTTSATAPGTLKRLSVSVLLDRAVVSPAEVASIWRPSIQAAAGIDPKRDGANALKVMTVAFDRSAVKRLQAQATGATASHPLLDLVERLLVLLAVALLLFFAGRAIRRAAGNRVPRQEPLDLLALESTRGETTTLDKGAAAARLGSIETRAAIDEHSAIETEIADLIERQPDEVAQTLRSWLADRRA
jgi:flagellar M-ring protein FliF